MHKIDRVYCNRSLKLESIKAIGFDLDYTLAMYLPTTFETLVYDTLCQKLVENGYPKEILNWSFDHTSMIRGLVIDKYRGNILKLDRHYYVKLAYHGFDTLTHDERILHYDKDKAIEYREPNFAFLDTFFSITEAFLVSKLVKYQDEQRPRELKDKNYFDFYVDVKKHLDLAHRDSSLKSTVAANPEKYLIKDVYLKGVLISLKKSGKKLFILTNSLWNYVNSIMSYLLSDNHLPCNNWTDYFDFVITGSQKPQFFTSKNLLYEVDKKNGFLKNLSMTSHLLPEKGIKFFQGGHVEIFQEMLKVLRGSEILYVGDHIYGDIVKSKKIAGWRTLLILDELKNELEGKHHPIWGALLKTGNYNSIFSAQMSQYACLYTSKFTNLRNYDLKNGVFDATTDLLPHENL